MKTITSLSAVINSLWFYLEIKLVLKAQVSCFQDKPFNIIIYLIYINILYCLYIEVMLKIKYIIKINFTYFFLVYKMCY